MADDAKVVSIGRANSLPPGAVCEETIALLRVWLTAAERGELTQVLMAGISPSGTIRTEWAGNAGRNDALAAASGLQARVAQAWLMIE